MLCILFVNNLICSRLSKDMPISDSFYTWDLNSQP